MYKCEDCDSVFDSPKLIADGDSEDTPYGTMYTDLSYKGCPNCESQWWFEHYEDEEE